MFNFFKFSIQFHTLSMFVFLYENNFLPKSFSKLILQQKGNALLLTILPQSQSHTCLRNTALRATSNLANQGVVSLKFKRVCGLGGSLAQQQSQGEEEQAGVGVRIGAWCWGSSFQRSRLSSCWDLCQELEEDTQLENFQSRR